MYEQIVGRTVNAGCGKITALGGEEAGRFAVYRPVLNYGEEAA